MRARIGARARVRARGRGRGRARGRGTLPVPLADRAHVGHGAHEGAALAEGVLQLGDATEVAHLDLAAQVEQDVLRLDVAVHLG